MKYLKLEYPLWKGWIIDEHGLHSPEGETWDPARLYYFHWQWQIMAHLRERLNKPEQYDFFDSRPY